MSLQTRVDEDSLPLETRPSSSISLGAGEEDWS